MEPQVFCLSNLSSSVVSTDRMPWSWATPIPHFPTKERFRDWCKAPDTDDCFFSLIEGLTPGQRVGKENVPIKAHGFIADFDAPCDSLLFESIISRCQADALPYAISKTYSGHARVVWVFAEPLLIQEQLWPAFIKELVAGLGVEKILPGYDKASENPAQYFHRGCEWKNFGHTIPSTKAELWLFASIDKRKPIKETFLPPMEDIAKEVETRWPGQWPGEFRVGARGPLFWLGDGVTRIGCQVVPDGVICYSSRAGVPFKSWEALLGSKFMSKYQELALGEMTNDIWYDGATFWRKTGGVWRDVLRADLTTEFRCKGLFSTLARGQSASDVDRIFYYINTAKRVDAAVPQCFEPEILYRGKKRILNTSCVEPLAAAESSGVWGDGFPWIASLFDGWFSSEEQLEPFMAWFQKFYQGALEHDPRLGSICILCGPVQKGKSLIANRIIGGLAGAYEDAADFLGGDSAFNARLFDAPVWVVDDTTSTSNQNKHAKYSAMLKKAAAGTDMVWNEKFLRAKHVTWKGRIVISLNDDPDSLSAIPSLDASIMDKLMIFRCSERNFTFPDSAEITRILGAELPHFAGWLLKADLSSQQENNRYGLKVYHEPTVVVNAQDTQQGGFLAELLDRPFRELLEEAQKQGRQHAEFTPTALYTAIEGRFPSIRAIKPDTFAKHLRKLAARTSFDFVLRQSTTTKYGWEIRHRESGSVDAPF